MKGRVFVLRANGAGAAPPAPPPPNAPPINTLLPVISGTQQVGQTLSVTDGTWAGFPAPTLTYQWRRAGNAIPGANASTYLLQTADAGLQVWCDVTGTNGSGALTVASNALTIAPAPAVNTPPVNTSSPVVSGATAIGSTLAASPGGWSGSPSPSFAYQWRRNGVDIAGATGSTYVTQPGDASASISCRVTGTNIAGSASAVSNAITVAASGGGSTALAWFQNAWASGAWSNASWLRA